MARRRPTGGSFKPCSARVAGRRASTDSSEALVSGFEHWKGECMSFIVEKIVARMSARRIMSWAVAAAFAVASLTPRLAQAQYAYVVQGDTLYSVDSSTSRTALSTGWSGATSMAFDAFIHIVQNSRLFRVTAQGARTQLGIAEWGGATEMAWNHVT